MPLAVRPVNVAAPAEAHGTGASGSVPVEVTPGYNGTMTASISGLLGTTPENDSVVTGPFDQDAPEASAATDRREVDVAAGTKVVRFDVDGAANDDLDLWVYRVNDDGDEELVDLSADGDADEQVTLVDPEPGTYVAYVNGFATPGGGGYVWSQWVVGSADAGNASVSPTSTPVTIGQKVTFTVSWSGLDTAKRWLGFLNLGNGTEDIGGTVVSVN
jgi:hypothetical protein